MNVLSDIFENDAWKTLNSVGTYLYFFIFLKLLKFICWTLGVQKIIINILPSYSPPLLKQASDPPLWAQNLNKVWNGRSVLFLQVQDENAIPGGWFRRHRKRGPRQRDGWREPAPDAADLALVVVVVVAVA